MSTSVLTAGDPIVLPYNDVEITTAINDLPPAFGTLGAAGMFPAEPLASIYFEISIENGVLSALPVTNDGPATIAQHGPGASRIFKVPMIQHLDNVKASDIRGMLSMAAASRKPETLDDLFARRLMLLRKKFDMTWELMAMSALKGVIIDGAGVVIYDLFAAFEITPKIVYFDLDDPNADIAGACEIVYDLIQQDLSDEASTGVEARVSSTFFKKLVAHPKVTQFYQNTAGYAALANLVRGKDGDFRPREFTHENITFLESSTTVPMWQQGPQRLIASGKGHAYPAGTLDSHVTYVAPPEDIRSLDGGAADIEDMIHVTTEPMKHGKGMEMMGQSNALPFWRRPKLLVTLDAGVGVSTQPVVPE